MGESAPEHDICIVEQPCTEAASPAVNKQDTAREDAARAQREKTKARNRAYYKANSEVIKQQQSTYREANREKLAIKQSNYRAADREKVKEQLRKYYRKNSKKLIEYQAKRYKSDISAKIKDQQRVYRIANRAKKSAATAAWRKNNPEANREWRKSNLDASRAIAQRRRARKLSADGTHTAADLNQIRKAQKDKCACCRKALKGAGHVDHIVALANGGSDWPDNLQYLCASCNRSKSARDPIEFMQSLGRLL